jgi:hypothetical protein
MAKIDHRQQRELSLKKERASSIKKIIEEMPKVAKS